MLNAGSDTMFEEFIAVAVNLNQHADMRSVLQQVLSLPGYAICTFSHGVLPCWAICTFHIARFLVIPHGTGLKKSVFPAARLLPFVCFYGMHFNKVY